MSTRNLHPGQPDSSKPILVIGNGIAGRTIAHRLVKAGLRPIIISPRERFGSATGAAIGTSVVKGITHAESPLFNLKLQGHYHWKTWLSDLEKDTGCRIPWAMYGVYEPYLDMMGFEGIKRRVFRGDMEQAHRYIHYKESDFKCLSHIKWLPQQVLGLFYYHEDGWLDPQSVMKALGEFLQKQGVQVIEERALRIESHSQGVRVFTEGSEITGEKVIVACGIFADELLRESQIPLPAQKYSGGITLSGPAPGSRQSPEDYGAFVQEKFSSVFLGDRFVFGSASFPLSYSQLIHRGELEKTLKNHKDNLLIPMQRLGMNVPVDTTLFGVRGKFKDMQPVIGSVPGFFDRVSVALGYYKNGLQIADFLAIQLVNHLLLREVSPLFCHFSPQRLVFN